MAWANQKRVCATYEGDKMNRLQINIELAKALGWKEWIMPDPRNTYKIEDERVYCWEDGAWFKFDYRDPVVFVAICKHWGITTQFRQNAAVLCHDDFSVDYVPSDSIEKAAALLVIDLVKRGVN